MKKSLVESNPPSATKYMKRFLSPSNQERSPYPGKEVKRKYDLIPFSPPPQPKPAQDQTNYYSEFLLRSSFYQISCP